MSERDPVHPGELPREDVLPGLGISKAAAAERTVDISGIPTLKPGRLRGTGARRAGQP